MKRIISQFFWAIGLAILGFGRVGAQAAPSPNPCMVHLDKSFYVTGEIIWYQLYLPPVVRGKNLSVRVSVTHSAGAIQESYYLKNEGQTYVNGYFKIPFDFSTGLYHLVFEGADKETRKFERLAVAIVPVFNDLGEELPAGITSTDGASAAQPQSGNLNIAIELVKDSFQCREQIRPRIVVRDKNGAPVKAHLSITVTDWDLCGPETVNRTNIAAGQALTGEKVGMLDGALYYKGQWMDNKGNPAAAKVVGVFSPEDQKLYYSNTDAAGNLFLELPDFTGKKAVQLLGWEKENMDIKVRMETAVPVEKQGMPGVTEGLKNYLRLSAERKKIFQYYKTLETALDPVIPEIKVKDLNSDMKVFPKEFQPFPNVATFFREVLRPISFTMNKDSVYDARIYNDQIQGLDEYYPGPPMFIIDGKVTRDVDFVAKLDLSLVERVDLFFRFQTLRPQFNVLGSNGVARIITNAVDLVIPESDEEDIVAVSGLLPKAQFPVFEPAQMAVGGHFPFFRPQLYWNPSLTTNESGRTEFSYYQSDEISRFRIQVVAQGEDGTYGVGERVYGVVVSR